MTEVTLYNRVIPELADIKSDQIVYILQMIKYMRTRMKEPEIKSMNFARAYDTLGKDPMLDHFFDRYTKLFIQVLENKPGDLQMMVTLLYYKDMMNQGKITQTEVDVLSKELAKKHMPQHLYDESNKNITDLKTTGKLDSVWESDPSKQKLDTEVTEVTETKESKE